MHSVSHILSLPLSFPLSQTHTHTPGSCSDTVVSICWLTDPSGYPGTADSFSFSTGHAMLSKERWPAMKKELLQERAYVQRAAVSLLSQDTQVPLLHFLYAGPWKSSLTSGRGTLFSFKLAFFTHRNQKITAHDVYCLINYSYKIYSHICASSQTFF